MNENLNPEDHRTSNVNNQPHAHGFPPNSSPYQPQHNEYPSASSPYQPPTDEFAPEVPVYRPQVDEFPPEAPDYRPDLGDSYDNTPFEQQGNVVVRRVRSEPKDTIISPKAKRKGALYSFLDSVKFITLGLLIGVLLVVFVVQRNDVLGTSMEPTLHQGDAVFVELVSRYFTGFHRNDVVTVDASNIDPAVYDRKDKIIKRVIGLPGERITISDGQVYINGVLLDEPYLAEGVMTFLTPEAEAKGFGDITLGSDEYYCMGDNRGGSLDSRRLGPISSDRIKARVIARIFPLNQMRFF